MENTYISSYNSSHRKRKFKDKNLSYKYKIMMSFNFVYAGIVNVFILPEKGNYYIVCTGFTYDGFNIFFSKNRHMKKEYHSLYTAILAFNQIVQVITQSLDWFTPYYFDDNNFYENCSEDLF